MLSILQNSRFSKSFGLYGYVALSFLAFATFGQYSSATGGSLGILAYVAFAAIAGTLFVLSYGVAESFRNNVERSMTVAGFAAFPAIVGILLAVGTAFGSLSGLPEAVLLTANFAVLIELYARFRVVKPVISERVFGAFLIAIAASSVMAMTL